MSPGHVRRANLLEDLGKELRRTGYVVECREGIGGIEFSSL